MGEECRSSTRSTASSQQYKKFDHMKFFDNPALLHRTYTKSNIFTTDVAGQISDDEEMESIIEIIEEDEELAEIQEIRAATHVYVVDKPGAVQIDKIADTKGLTEAETRERIDTKKVRSQLLIEDSDKGRSERMALLRDIAQRATTTVPQFIEDSVDLFFKSLAATAKSFSPWHLAEAKLKVFLVMTEIEERNAEEKYRDQHGTTPNPSLSASSTPSSPISLSFSSNDSNSTFNGIGQNVKAATREYPRPFCNANPTNQVRSENGSDIENKNEDMELQCIIEEDEQISDRQRNRPKVTQVYKMNKAEAVQIDKTANPKVLTESETRERIDKKKARTKLLVEDSDKGRSERMSLLRDIAQQATTSMPQSIDESVDLFFQSLAATAKTLSPSFLAEAKRKFLLDLAEIDEKNVEEKYREPSFIPTPKPSPLPASSTRPSPSLTLPYCSKESTCASHAIGQKEHVTLQHPPSYNTNPTNQVRIGDGFDTGSQKEKTEIKSKEEKRQQIAIETQESKTTTTQICEGDDVDQLLNHLHGVINMLSKIDR